MRSFIAVRMLCLESVPTPHQVHKRRKHTHPQDNPVFHLAVQKVCHAVLIYSDSWATCLMFKLAKLFSKTKKNSKYLQKSGKKLKKGHLKCRLPNLQWTIAIIVGKSVEVSRKKAQPGQIFHLDSISNTHCTWASTVYFFTIPFLLIFQVLPFQLYY